jgi:hypothetical protein
MVKTWGGTVRSSLVRTKKGLQAILAWNTKKADFIPPLLTEEELSVIGNAADIIQGALDSHKPR